jgi:hypothetical protein
MGSGFGSLVQGAFRKARVGLPCGVDIQPWHCRAYSAIDPQIEEIYQRLVRVFSHLDFVQSSSYLLATSKARLKRSITFLEELMSRHKVS